MDKRYFPLPDFAEPSLLTHPNIPRPLHQVNPRSIRGATWWNKVRKEAYAERGYKCYACATPKSAVKGNRKVLEAHERYEIDYEAGRVYFRGLVALCPFCHSFIHSGRLFALYQKGERSKSHVWSILTHGMQVLDRHNRTTGDDLHPFWFTILFVYMLRYNLDINSALKLVESRYEIDRYEMPPWGDWRLVLDDGSEHGPKFKDENAWLGEFDPDVSHNVKGRY